MIGNNIAYVPLAQLLFFRLIDRDIKKTILCLRSFYIGEKYLHVLLLPTQYISIYLLYYYYHIFSYTYSTYPYMIRLDQVRILYEPYNQIYPYFLHSIICLVINLYPILIRVIIRANVFVTSTLMYSIIYNSSHIECLLYVI
jgi:hypothetical protein